MSATNQISSSYYAVQSHRNIPIQSGEWTHDYKFWRI